MSRRFTMEPPIAIRVVYIIFEMGAYWESRFGPIHRP